MSAKMWMLLVFLAISNKAHGDENTVILLGDHGDPKYDKLLTNNTVDDAKSIREMIQKIEASVVKPPVDLSELKSVRENLLKSPAAQALSTNLTRLLQDSSLDGLKVSNKAPILGASEAIADPSINVIDSHVSQIINTTNGNNFQPNVEEMKMIASEKHGGSNLHNLLRESLMMEAIIEEGKFTLGVGVEQWKTVEISFEKTALIGRTSNSIIVATGHGSSYELLTSLEFDVPPNAPFHLETMKLFDSKLDRARNLVLVALQGHLIWHELMESELIEIQRWNLLKEIESLVHFTHDGCEILLVSTVDDAGKVQAEFIEFNVPDGEFWVIQAFALPERSPSMAMLDLGGDVIVAFVQNNSLSIYRHQFTKHLRGKFVLFKTIKAANVSIVSGFRIGGHSYIAIGGDQPQILRYFNGDFHEQTILSQSFGFVEEFLPIPIRTYRDDLVLLVQHRLQLGSHTLAVVDALVWNGIAFENAMAVPCHIRADPNANGFTCMLDAMRDDGFLGAAYIHHEKENGLYVLIPRVDAHSGLFRLNYTFVEAEDPLMKEMEQIKKSIELINQMLAYEDTVKKEVEDALKVAMDPNNDFMLDGLTWIDELETDFLELAGNVELGDNLVEFIDSTWTQEDFLVNLDALEATIAADEQKLKMIDDELNKLNRFNRQAPIEPKQRDSQVINLGSFDFNGPIDLKTMKILPPENSRQPRQKNPEQQPQALNVGSFTFNGKLDPKTIRTLPQPEGNQRKSRQIKAMEESRVEFLIVKDLQVEKINGIPFSDLIFVENGQLIVPNRDISFNGFVEAENVNMLNNGRVNGIDFSHEVLAVQSPNRPSSLVLQHLVVQSLDVGKINDVAVDVESLKLIDLPSDVQANLTANSVIIKNNLNVVRINGVSWNEFVDKLVPKHIPSTIDEITVDGDVWVAERGHLNVTTLNNLRFPEEYVLRAGPRDTIITGRKIFAGEVVTSAIDTNGEIDGIEPSKMITLDQRQEIAAETTFHSLGVIKKLEVNGTIDGRELHEFLPNPTLAEANQILAACNFKELFVEGTVTIEDTLNGQRLETILTDVVYETKDGSEVIINAPKSFIDLEVTEELEVANNIINDVSLDNIMMTDRDQVLSFGTLSGDIFFRDLKLTGLYDGINATELEHKSFRTFGDQFIEAPITTTENRRVEAAFSDVKMSLNGITAGDFLSVDQPVDLSGIGEIMFEELNVENVVVDGHVDGPGVFKNLNISDLISSYLSKSRSQEIRVPTKIETLTTNETFFASSINGINFEVFKNYMRGIQNFKSLILSGEQKLDNLIIDGNVNLKRINGRDFNQIVQNAIWLNRPNTIGNIKFLDEVTVDGALTVREKVNGKFFKAFTDNWISNQEKSINISSDKVFSKNVIVEEALETGSINSIRFEDLLMVKDAEFLRDLEIHGNVNVEKLSVGGMFNDKIVKNFEELYSFDAASETHIVHSNVHFNQPAVINYLNTPLINQINVSSLMANLIKTDEGNVFVTSEKIFANPLVALQGIFVDTINDMEMSFLDKVVPAYDPIPSLITINGDLAFAGDVYSQLIAVNGDLYTRYISSCDIKEWEYLALPLDKTLEINGVIHINSSAFKPTNLHADYLNGLPLTKLFTLRTNQTFDHEIEIVGRLEVAEPLIVRGPVNGFSIEHERENTVMLNEDHQVVKVKTSFGAARVYGPLTTYGKVNSKNLQNIVLLHSSPTIESAASFSSLEGSSLYTNDLISGTKFNSWYENVLWNQGKDVQTVSGNWRIKRLRLSDDVTGNGLINGVSISQIERNLKNSINVIDSAIKDHVGQYQYLCQTLGVKGNNSQNAIYILKHLEFEFKLQEASEIFSYFTFRTSAQNDYIGVNTNCTTQLYKWQSEAERFKLVGQVETGVVYDWEIVKNVKDDAFIITNSRMEANYPCQFGGLNVWKMNDDQMFHVNTIPTESDVLELHVNPQLPGRFFTLNNLDTVEHFDVFGEKKEFWKLPFDHYNYSFVPSEVLSDLTLFNGQKLFMLESKFKSRQARFLFKDSSYLKKGRPGDSPVHRLSPALSKQFSLLPSIPSKPLFDNRSDGNNKTSNLNSIRNVKNAFQKSLNEKLSQIPKLAIRNILPNERNLKLNVATNETAAKNARADVLKPFASEAVNKESPTPKKELDTITDRSISTKEVKDRDKVSNVNGLKEKVANVKNALHKSLIENFSKASKLPTKPADTASPDELNRNQKFGSTTKAAVKEETVELESVNAKAEITESTKPLEEELTTIRDETALTELVNSPATEASTSTTTKSQETTTTSTEATTSEDITTTTAIKAENETTKSTKLPVSILEPKIYLSPPSQDENFLESDFPSETTRFAEVTVAENVEAEAQVPHEVLTGSGLKEAENPYFPEHGAGELVMMFVGPRQQKKVLYAVTRTRDSIIKGNHNIIEIYNDIFDGSIYQNIHCTDPSNLAVLQFRDETLLAFLENRSEIQVFIYRGIQGFVGFKRIKLPGYADQMTSITLPPKIDYKCDRHYLLVRMDTKILFYGVKISGNCGVDEVNCGY